MLHERSQHACRWRSNGDRTRWSLLLRGLPLILFWAFGLGILPEPGINSGLGMGSLVAQSLVPQATGPIQAAGVSLSPEQTRQSIQWLADHLVKHIPSQIDGDDNWGDTKEVWSGLKVRRDGWKIKTKRRHRDIKHGRWVSLPHRSAED